MDISDIGSSDDTALLCITNRPPSIYGNRPHSGGDWYSPDGTRVGIADHNDVQGLDRSRGPMVVRLRRSGSGTPTEGIYHCIIEDSTSMFKTVDVGLYNSGGGNNRKSL